MRRKAIWPLLILAGILALTGEPFLLSHHTVQARARESNPARETPAGHVTILILDMSGSMADNDPAQVRCQAAEAFIDLNGPGNMVGLIGMTGTQAQVWQQPSPTDVTSERAALKQAIEKRPPGSPSCQNPAGNTPTASALSVAWDMLDTTTAQQNLLGSVILLSDGVPDPDIDNSQTNMIQNILIPRFQQRHWPIDTIALGTGAVLRSFLQKLARLTGGLVYDDARGPVPDEISSLNILPFFTDILNQRLGHSVTTNVPLTTLSAGIRAYNMTLDTTVRELDVLLVRDASAGESITARLISPGLVPLVLPSQIAIPDTDVEQNPSYMAFSIEGPLAGEWELDISGNGRFEVSVLETSWLQVAFLNPRENGTLLNIGAPFPLIAAIVDARGPDTPLNYPDAMLTAILTYQDQPGATFTTRQYPLKGAPVPGSGQYEEYQAIIRLPADASEGTYTLTVTITGQTSAIIAENTLTVRLVHFPEPVLSTNPVIEYRWPSWASSIFHLPLLGQLYALAFADSNASISGTIQIGGSPYPDAHVAQATLVDPTGQPIPLAVTGDEPGRFQVSLPDEPAGTYALALTLAGTFEGDTGRFDSTDFTIQLEEQPATGTMMIGFFAFSTLLALLMLCLLISGYLFLTGPKPFGECQSEETGERYDFSRARRSLGPWRNHLRSDAVPAASGGDPLPKGLRFRFSRKIPLVRPRRILARLRGKDGRYWKAWLNSEERPLSRWRYHEVSHLNYQLVIDEDARSFPPRTYSVLPAGDQYTRKAKTEK